MNALPIRPAEGLVLDPAALAAHLVGFWADDVWPLAACPLPSAAQARRTLRLTLAAPTLKVELKYAIRHCYTSGRWSPASGSLVTHLQQLVVWLNALAPAARSFVERPLADWETELATYLQAHGRWHPRVSVRLDATQTPRRHVGRDSHQLAFGVLYRVVAAAYDTRSEWEKDSWDVRRLGVALNHTRSNTTLNFARITQPWLRDAAKQYLRYCLAQHDTGSSFGYLQGIVTFSRFLAQRAAPIRPEQIDRALLLDYFTFLAAQDLAVGTHNKRISHVRTLLDLSAREGWAAVPARALIYDDDFRPPRRGQPRFIPDAVLAQIHAHLDALPAPMGCMLAVLEESGMRISELCGLPRDCLTQDHAGDWFLRYYQGKQQKEHSIPIARAVALLIQAQQRTGGATGGPAPAFLFYSRRGAPMKSAVFRAALNQFCYDHQIRDATGALCRLKPHQFRHTKGTALINGGMAQHLVQRFLGHETPTMTSVYAHIHDQTLKEAYAAFRGQTIDVRGRVVEEDVAGLGSPEDQWLKRNILAQALPNGTCALPTITQGCPHANACLTCVHFRTDRRHLADHRDQLQRTQQLLTVARTNGWTRQLEMNRQVAANLLAIVTQLEADDDAPTQPHGPAPERAAAPPGGAPPHG